MNCQNATIFIKILAISLLRDLKIWKICSEAENNQFGSASHYLMWATIKAPRYQYYFVRD